MRYGRSSIASSDQPIQMMRDLISPLDKVFIVIDGIDEINEPATVGKLRRELVSSTKGAQLLFLGRDKITLRSELGAAPGIYMSSTVVAEDINNYLIEELDKLAVADKGLKARMFEVLSNNANGMFLWAHLMIRSLKSASSPYDIEEILSSLPPGLETLYSITLNSLAKEQPRRKLLAKRILQWISCSARPLHWEELQTALAFDEHRAEFIEPLKPFKAAVIDLSGSLFEYVPNDDLFRLVHNSVREFLFASPDDQHVHVEARQFFVQEQSSHAELAKACLAYQIQYIFQDCTKTDYEKSSMSEYSTRFWCHHVYNACYSSGLHHSMNEFLSSSIRRQTWIFKFLFWEPSTFPLQTLMKLRRLLKDWAASGLSTQATDCTFNWVRDIPSILLGKETLNPTMGGYMRKDTLPAATEMTKISYFEKLMVIRDLSREYTMMGTLSAGEGWLMQSLESQRSLHGPSHISTVWLMNGLGLIYDQQQKTAQSARIQESALKIQMSVLGPDDLETTWTVNELGRVYRHLGQFEKAEWMHLRALIVLRKALHPKDL